MDDASHALRSLSGDTVRALVGRRLAIGDLAAELTELTFEPGDAALWRPATRLADAAQPWRHGFTDPFRLANELSRDLFGIAERSTRAAASGVATVASDIATTFGSVSSPELDVEHATATCAEVTARWLLADGAPSVELDAAPLAVRAEVSRQRIVDLIVDQIPESMRVELSDTAAVDQGQTSVIGRVLPRRKLGSLHAPLELAVDGADLVIAVGSVGLGSRSVGLAERHRQRHQLRPFGEHASIDRLELSSDHLEVEFSWAAPRVTVPWTQMVDFLRTGRW